MSVRIERKHLDSWVDANGPSGLEKLAKKAGLSKGFLARVRSGEVPKRRYNRIRLASVVGVSEDELFPLQREESAS